MDYNYNVGRGIELAVMGGDQSLDEKTNVELSSLWADAKHQTLQHQTSSNPTTNAHSRTITMNAVARHHKVSIPQLKDTLTQYRGAGEPKRLDGDRHIYEELVGFRKPMANCKKQVEHNHDEIEEDVIQRVLAHAIQCCVDERDIDIYQVFAIRLYDKVSGEPRLKNCGYFDIITVPPFIKTVLIFICCAFVQTVGITTVILGLFFKYFQNEDIDDYCVLDANRWTKAWSLRLLACSLSFIIAYYVTITIQIFNIQDYELTDRLYARDIYKVKKRSFVIIMGQMINYYVFISGCWFIFAIYRLNEGELDENGNVDYSHAGLDMVLNGVAVFFLLELDDVIVAKQDLFNVRTLEKY